MAESYIQSALAELGKIRASETMSELIKGLNHVQEIKELLKMGEGV